MFNKWNNFWKAHSLSSFALWNIVVWSIVAWIAIEATIAESRNSGDGSAHGILLLFFSPIIIVTLVLDLYRLIRWLINK